MGSFELQYRIEGFSDHEQWKSVLQHIGQNGIREPNSGDRKDLYALRQAIFDVLSEVRYTPEGSVGRQTRVSVKVPFRREEFQDTFGKIMNNKTGATGNNECFLPLEDLNVVFGDDRWSRRQYTTSTETFISSKEFIHISWGYKERLNYNHTQCKR